MKFDNNKIVNFQIVNVFGVLAHPARARHWQCRGERFESAILHNLTFELFLLDKYLWFITGILLVRTGLAVVFQFVLVTYVCKAFA